MKKHLSILLFILMWAAVLGSLGAYAWWCAIADGWLLWLPVLVIPLLGVHLHLRCPEKGTVGCLAWLLSAPCALALLCIVCLANRKEILMSGWVGFSFTSLGLFLYLLAMGAFSWSSWIGNALARMPWFYHLVALHATDWSARCKSVRHLTDQSVLTGVAKNDEDCRVRRKAVECLTSQAALTDIAKHARDSNMRYAAVMRLTDQAVLADIAKNDEDCRMRSDAVMRLTDQAALADLAENDKERWVCKMAVGRLFNQAGLASVAKNGRYSDVRMQAADKLDDKTLAQAVYADVVKNGMDFDMRMQAADKLDDRALAQTVYIDVAKNDKYSDVRVQAADKLDDKALAQSVYTDVAKNGEYEQIRKKAVACLTCQAALADVAKNDQKDAMESVYDEDVNIRQVECPSIYYVGERVAEAAPVGMAALAKLTSPALLADVAKNAKHTAVREAAAKKLAEMLAIAPAARDEFTKANNVHQQGSQ